MRVAGNVLVLLSFVWILVAPAGELNDHFILIRSFTGAHSYSKNEKFSIAIPKVYLAYDKDGKPIMGAAMRTYKTYKKVTSLLVVTKKNGIYVVTEADIPDIHLIKGEDKRKVVLDGARTVIGRTVKDKEGKLVKVDAVTGATRYVKRIFANYDLMARKIIEQMEADPTWEKILIQQD
ncbi:hypothetical protein BVY04_03505 [bacterium M21]|nr:hypothetical protein BVY04_03505 [bacterium M21]